MIYIILNQANPVEERTPTCALTLLAKLFWSLASVSVVCEGSIMGSGVLMESRGSIPKLGVSGLMELLNMLLYFVIFPLGDMEL